MNPADGSPAAPDLEARIAQLEKEFARLGAELVELRALASVRPAEPEPVAPEAVAAEPIPPIVPEAPAYWPPPPPRKAPPTPASTPTQAAPAAPQTTHAAAPVAPVGPPARTIGDLAREWDLMGARGFAIAGGAVTALGIGFF